MKRELYYPSQGAGQIHVNCWEPVGSPRAVIQIIHGIAEHTDRYDAFADFLVAHGFLVVAEDHMGHGKSIGKNGTQGFFHGGWFTAVADSYTLLQTTREEYPEIPYILFGHSMGSFMARTILEKYPQSGISGAVISGTGWMPEPVLAAGHGMCSLVCKRSDEKKPNEKLQGLVFGSYNKRVEHSRTAYDWLTRDKGAVDAYVADPLCGFTASAGLLRDMLGGMRYIQRNENLCKMNKKLPVHFISGGDDPVGGYGKGVQKAMDVFRSVGMERVSGKIYPLCRHELLNECNREEVMNDLLSWVNEML